MSPFHKMFPPDVTTESALSSNSSINSTFSDQPCRQLFLEINFYYTPFLILLGSLGNVISQIIFCNSKLKLQSTSVYLSALSVTDTVFLLQLLPPWLDAVQLSSFFYMPGVCYTVIYISYVSSCLSTWIVVAFTVERFVAVLYPLKRGMICNVNRAKYIVLLLTCAILVLNLPVLRFVSPSANCSIDSQYLAHAARFNMVDTAISFTIPLGAIVLLNARIMFGVWKVERARQNLLKVERQPGSRCVRQTQLPVTRSQHRVTRMLLVVSSVFVILNVPAYTMRIMAYTHPNRKEGSYWAEFQQLASLFFNTNFGINFLLYCVSGQNFRQALCKAFPCFRRRAIETIAARITPHQARSVSTSYASVGGDGLPSLIPPHEVVRPRVRRHRSEPVIRRWTFNNARTRPQHEMIEMNVLNQPNNPHQII